MIIDCISDFHGNYPELEGGDLLIVAGDLTARDTEDEYAAFDEWLWQQNYKKIIIIAGNHDNGLQYPERIFRDGVLWTKGDYLCDSGTEFSYNIDGFPEEDEKFLPNGKRTLKIWGSPWTKRFKGMNPHCMAFTCETEEELAEKWATIPNDIDILVTHSPPHGILDELVEEGYHVGSMALQNVVRRIRPKLHVFGHVHESYGMCRPILEFIALQGYPISVNASHVNEYYEPVNKPIRVIL